MKKRPRSIRIVEEGQERFVEMTCADGEVTREAVVKAAPKRRRYRPCPKVQMDRTRKKRF